VLWLQERTGLIDQIEHQRRKSKHTVGRIRLLVAPSDSLGNKAFECEGGHAWIVPLAHPESEW
jgi:hypothetical protein